MKDTSPKHRGGATSRMEKPDPRRNPVFFPLGHGGVYYQSILQILDRSYWKGWLTVELDSSPSRPPKESAQVSKQFLENALLLKPESFCGV